MTFNPVRTYAWNHFWLKQHENAAQKEMQLAEKHRTRLMANLKHRQRYLMELEAEENRTRKTITNLEDMITEPTPNGVGVKRGKGGRFERTTRDQGDPAPTAA